MDMVYRNVKFTNISAAGSGPDYGLLVVGARLRSGHPSAVVAGRTLQVVPPNPVRRLEESKWMTRAWVYQEAVCSRRSLVVTDDQGYFDCDSMTCRESADTHPEEISTSHTDYISPQFRKTPYMNQLSGSYPMLTHLNELLLMSESIFKAIPRDISPVTRMPLTEFLEYSEFTRPAR
jgi:hypothetical protein